MSLKVFDCEQYSEEWWACRLGIPTASQFSTVQAQGRGKAESVTRRKYLNQLASERHMGKVCEEAQYTNAHLERGRLMEADGAEVAALALGYELEMVGFYRNDETRCGCSPDRKIKGGGLLSIKTALPHVLTDYIRHDRFPAEHKAQSQGELWITGEPFVDLVIYWPGMPLFVKRCEPDQQYIMELADAVCEFNKELDQVADELRRYGGPSTLNDSLRDSLHVLEAG